MSSSALTLFLSLSMLMYRLRSSVDSWGYLKAKGFIMMCHNVKISDNAHFEVTTKMMYIVEWFLLCLQLLDQLLVARLLSTFSGGACCSSTWSRGLLLRD